MFCFIPLVWQNIQDVLLGNWGLIWWMWNRCSSSFPQIGSQCTAPTWALTAVSKKKWEADYDTVSSTKGKEVERLRETEITTQGKDWSWGHEVYSCAIKSKRCSSLRPGSWCCNPAVYILDNSPISPHTLLWPHNWVFSVSSGWIGDGGVGGGRLYIACLFSHFSLLQPRPCTICSTQWVFNPPAGRLELPQNKAR